MLLCIDLQHNWRMDSSCIYSVYSVQVLEITFWHALLLRTRQKTQQAHSMLHHCEQTDVTGNVFNVKSTVPNNCGWSKWVRPLRRSAGSSSCCCTCKLVTSVPSLAATPADPHHDQALGLQCCQACASCFWLIEPNWQSQTKCMQPVAFF